MAKNTAQAKSVIIVESPAKAKTISKYVGSNYEVCASVGHIMDLPKSELGVDVENDFEPKYETIQGKQKYISALKKACKKADVIYLAPDPDREGEAIAWHIQEKIGSDAKNKQFYRVLFNEITKKAVNEALQKPGELDVSKYEAQQSRRILDRLVGYKISPLLWEKIRRGLSAGRVQSVALRLICEREAEINAFHPEEYWTVEVDLQRKKGEKEIITARLVAVGDKKPEISDEKTANKIKSDLKKLPYVVSEVKEKQRQRNPVPPFITSTMQQEAFRRYRFSAKKTMMLAQHLYEGVELGDEGPVGLITYMRTDSTRVSPTAIDEVRKLIKSRYGKEYSLDKPRVFKVKKGAQDAHEAIRPTLIDHAPEQLKAYLDKDHLRLYEIIWNRFVASQMKEALFMQKSIDIMAGEYRFRLSGSTLKFDGFLRVYEESLEDMTKKDDELATLPELKKDEELNLEKIDPKQHFTMPPPRYTESTLIRTLEEKGVGRPSTYASILGNIQVKDYTTKNGVQFQPTELGMVVNELLVENFPKIIDVSFTAGMEDQLDKVEEGKMNWKKLLRDFYSTFSANLAYAKEHMRNLKQEEQPTDLICEKCNSPMVIKWGKNGHFIACSGYPDCKNTKEFRRTESGGIEIVEAEVTDEQCDDCKSPMVVKQGRFGKFLACSRYPDCRGTKSIPTGVKCPECKGDIVEKRSRRGRTFFGCSSYPKCNFALWDRPIEKECPGCGMPFMVEKIRKAGRSIQCSKKECGYKEEAND